MRSARVTARVIMTLLVCLVLPGGKGYAQGPSDSIPLKEADVAADAFRLGEPVPPWVEPVAMPHVTDPQPVVVVLAERQYLVEQTPAVYVRSAVLINDAAALSNAGLVSIPFVPQYHNVHLHAVRIMRGGESLDRTASSTIRFLQRETGLEQGVYSGEVTASVLVNDLRVGDTLEYAYTRYGQNPVFGDRFVDATFWDQGHPTTLRRIVLTHPASRRISWRFMASDRGKALVPQELTHDGMRKLVFEERSIPRVGIEPLTPVDYDVYRSLHFSEFAAWDDVAQWANNLFQVPAELDAELQEVVARLRQKPTTEERVVGALEFVQQDIRYFSVSLGESSHRPATPDVVLKRRYGDCKDKSLLLLTLLKALGVEARPVLVDVGRRRRLPGVLPGPQVFDHVIVEVALNGSAYYLDPTRLAQHGKLRQMGQAHENAHVLVVAPGGARLAVIASPNVQQLSRNEWQETAALAKFEENGALHVKQVWRGLMAETMRFYHERIPRDQLVKSIGALLEARYPGATMVGEPDIQDDRVDNVLTIAASYTVPKLATEQSGNWIVR